MVISAAGEGNGSPLQCSCLENPRAWWAAIYGVAQSWTRLKWLSKCDWTELNIMGFPDKESSCQYRSHGFDPWVGKIPWRRKWHSTPVILPGKSHGQRRLAGYSPWSRKEAETTERTHTHKQYYYYTSIAVEKK